LPWAPCTSACSLLAGMHIKQLKGNFRHNTETMRKQNIYILLITTSIIVYQHCNPSYFRWTIDFGWWSAVVRAVNGLLAAALYSK
jgi:hypothetical protein